MSVLPTLCATARRRMALASTVAVVAVVSGCAHMSQGDVCPATDGQEILSRINEVREGGGLEPLVVDLRLVQAARDHSESMRDDGFFDHIGPDGVEPAERVAATGYPWTFVAENLAAGDLTPSQVVAGWLESPLHRDNMLEPAAVHVGIAHASGGPGPYRQYWTAVFADTGGEVQGTETGCHP